MGSHQDIQVAAAVLSRRYEEQLFSHPGAKHNRVVPVLVITGFLGSGKTTTLQHLLTSTGTELQLGVLVNEVAALDVDGQLLSTAQSNAAAGIKAAQLAGGCACCSVSGNLQAALHELAGSSSYQQLDYLLLETSGVADVEPLAALLTSSGFKLAGVVTVVDAEAGASQLQQEEVAVAQLRAADVVVLNKCDLASLSALSAVEDLIQELAPGVRMLRARFGQVPPEALLDIDVDEAAEEDSSSSAAGAAAASQSVQGEIAFLSHEPVVSVRQLKGKQRPGSLVSSRHAAKLAAAAAVAGGTAGAGDASPQPLSQPHPHSSNHSHSHSHSSFVSVSYSSDQPLCMACFQVYVTHSLLPATGLFRAKGFVWFQQQRQLHYVFHISGKQRAECGATGRWQGPPGVQLVLIGQDQGVLQQLKEQLQECTAGCCACSSGDSRSGDSRSGKGTGPGAAAGACDAAADSTNSNRRAQVQQPQPPQQPSAQGGAGAAAAARYAQLVEQHHRFELWPQPDKPLQQQPQQQQPQQEQWQQPADAAMQQQQHAQGLEAAGGLVQFSAVGSALHGVIAEEVNAAVLRKANATPGLLFLCHINSPPALRTAAASSQQLAYQGVLALQLCFQDAAESAAEQQWAQLEAAVAPVLRKAYQHVHNCKCDVVQLVTSGQG